MGACVRVCRVKWGGVGWGGVGGGRGELRAGAADMSGVCAGREGGAAGCMGRDGGSEAGSGCVLCTTWFRLPLALGD